MNNRTFQTLLQAIRDNVDSYIRTGDTKFLDENKGVWIQLHQAGRGLEASKIFQKEALKEMDEAISDITKDVVAFKSALMNR